MKNAEWSLTRTSQRAYLDSIMIAIDEGREIAAGLLTVGLVQLCRRRRSSR